MLQLAQIWCWWVKQSFIFLVLWLIRRLLCKVFWDCLQSFKWCFDFNLDLLESMPKCGYFSLDLYLLVAVMYFTFDVWWFSSFCWCAQFSFPHYHKSYCNYSVASKVLIDILTFSLLHLYVLPFIYLRFSVHLWN